MKKLYLSILAAGLTIGVTAQEHQKSKFIPQENLQKQKTIYNQAKTAIWSDDFSVPANWTMAILPGASNHNWVIGTNAPSGDFAIDPIESTTAANGFALFDSDRLGSNTAVQDAIIYNTTPIDLSAEPYVSIKFESMYRKFRGNCYVGFSTDATNWTYVEVHNNLNTNRVTTNPEIVSFPAPVIAGSSTAYICFRYKGSWDYAWMVDDVELFETPDYDLKVEWELHETEMYQYKQIPINQVEPTRFRTVVVNHGKYDLNNVTFNVNVTGAETATVSSTPITLVPLARDTISVTYTPSTIGSYVFNQDVTMDETDDNPVNNGPFSTPSFEVGQHIYAVDAGTPYRPLREITTYYTGSTTPHNEVGCSYDIFQATKLCAIDVHISDSCPSDIELFGVLYEFDPSVGWQQINETPYIIVNDSHKGRINSLTFDNFGVDLLPGTYMVSIRELGTKNAVLSSSGSTSAGAQTLGYVNLSAPQTGQGWMRIDMAPVIRMNFNTVLLSTHTLSELEGVKIYPNPSTGVVNISNDLNVENTITITDVKGGEIISKTSSIATSVDLSSFGTGIYFVKVSNENGNKVEKVVIK